MKLAQKFNISMVSNNLSDYAAVKLCDIAQLSKDKNVFSHA